MDILEPCKATGYELETITYDAKSKMAHNMIKVHYQKYNIGSTTYNHSEDGSSTTVIIQYSTTDISVTERTKLISGNSFVSSVGGNLGLFVGFSFMDSLFAIYNFIHERLTKRRE